MYKIICVLYKLTTNISRNFKKAADELHYLKYKMEFGEKDDDIYIAAYPKSGTTLMQMLIYQLTTDGGINFKHIYDVSPWTRNASIKRLSPPELKSPRLIKTHDQYKEFDRETKGRFIFVHRNGMDVAVSMFHQERSYNDPDVDFNKFITDFFTKKKFNWFDYNQDWFENKYKLPILFIRYEDLLDDFDTCLYKVAGFLNIQINPDNLPRIRERCSFQFMKQHEDKFGEQPPEKKKVYNQFIRKGKAGEGEELLSPEHKAIFIKRYEKQLKNFEFCFF